jgi:hypothetical protein
MSSVGTLQRNYASPLPLPSGNLHSKPITAFFQFYRTVLMRKNMLVLTLQHLT